MSQSSRLLAIELEAFRGFAARQRLDLDADIVLVRGDNGTGKTSVVDGMLWLFTDSLPRLIDRAKGRRKGPDPIGNCYRPGTAARVCLTVGMTDGRIVKFERTGGSDKSELLAWDGDKRVDDAANLLAQAFGASAPAQMVQAVSSWGILQQHSLLAALDSGAELHQRLAEVIGLERVTGFADSASEVAKRISRDCKQLENVQKSLVERRAAVAAQLVAARAEAQERVDRGVRIAGLVEKGITELPVGLALRRLPALAEEVAAAGREVAMLSEFGREISSHHGDLSQSGSAVADAVDLVERELDVLMKRADDAVKRAPVQVQLASAALELMGDDCPVCGQAIDAASVRTHMTELLQTANRESAAAAAAQLAVAEAQTRLQNARQAEERRKAARTRLDGAITRMQEYLAGTTWIVIAPDWQAPEKAGELSAHLMGLQATLHSAHAEAQRDANERITRFISEIETFDAEVQRGDAKLGELRLRASHASSLDTAARRAAERIVERALKRLGPSFAEVFDRLAPHPTFTELRASQDIFYGKNQVVPEVYDSAADISGNPALIFSEGQLNVVALSYFLGLALNAGDAALPFVVLDDPLQAMDVLSVLGFADLCRRLRERRQIIVTTHDRRFASLLGRKLAPREAGSRTVLHEFEGWTAEGPQIQSTDEPLADVIPLLARRAS